MLEGSQSGGYGQPKRIWVRVVVIRVVSRVLGRVVVIRVGRVGGRVGRVVGRVGRVVGRAVVRVSWSGFVVRAVVRVVGRVSWS